MKLRIKQHSSILLVIIIIMIMCSLFGFYLGMQGISEKYWPAVICGVAMFTVGTYLAFFISRWYYLSLSVPDQFVYAVKETLSLPKAYINKN